MLRFLGKCWNVGFDPSHASCFRKHTEPQTQASLVMLFHLLLHRPVVYVQIYNTGIEILSISSETYNGSIVYTMSPLPINSSTRLALTKPTNPPVRVLHWGVHFCEIHWTSGHGDFLQSQTQRWANNLPWSLIVPFGRRITLSLYSITTAILRSLDGRAITPTPFGRMALPAKSRQFSSLGSTTTTTTTMTETVNPWQSLHKTCVPT